mgnify:CR=1 FL=1
MIPDDESRVAPVTDAKTLTLPSHLLRPKKANIIASLNAIIFDGGSITFPEKLALI